MKTRLVPGVPGLKAPLSIDTDTIMRDAVLKNQLIFDAVNGSIAIVDHAPLAPESGSGAVGGKIRSH